MMNIIKGKELSVFVVNSITLAKAKKPNNDGVLQKFAILSLTDEDAPGSQPVRHIMFESDYPSFIETLTHYRKQEPDARGGYLVDMKALKASDDFDEIKGYLTWNGGMCMDYPLRKGLCYANDIDGVRTVKKNGQAVVKDTISVFVQVKYAETAADGSLIYRFVKGLGLNEQGSRIEDTFFQVPFDSNNVAAPAQPQQAAAPAATPEPEAAQAAGETISDF